jgi:hypothetical protein
MVLLLAYKSSHLHFHLGEEVDRNYHLKVVADS